MTTSLLARIIAGIDAGGGADIQAELKTCALGGNRASIITAPAAQNARTVMVVGEVSPTMVAAQTALEGWLFDAVDLGAPSGLLQRAIEAAGRSFASRRGRGRRFHEVWADG